MAYHDDDVSATTLYAGLVVRHASMQQRKREQSISKLATAHHQLTLLRNLLQIYSDLGPKAPRSAAAHANKKLAPIPVTGT